MANYKALALHEGEDVIMEVRKHWVVFLGYGAGLVFMACLPLVAFMLVSVYAPAVFSYISGSIYSLFSFVYLLWVLSLWILFFLDWTKYYLDVWYVTQERIIVVEQRTLFDRQVSNVRFDRIQDVSVNIDGVIATFLDFGNIVVQTASEDNTKFTITTVRHPEEVRRVVFSQHNMLSQRHNKQGLGNTIV
ncbi:MAG: PH domain-containing protein [Minisyncoccia bacterium]